MQRIRRSSQDALQIINGLLSFAQTDDRTHEPEELQLASLLNSVFEQLELLLEQHKTEVRLELAVDPVHFNGFALKQTLLNVIENAVKYRNEERGLVITIKSYVASGDYVVIDVIDNGLGMSSEQAQQVFEKNLRLHAGLRQVEGQGIGLYAARKLMQSGGGDLFVRSSGPEGSCFSIVLNSSLVV